MQNSKKVLSNSKKVRTFATDFAKGEQRFL